MVRMIRHAVALAALCLSSLSAWPAGAAPQILGLVASNGLLSPLRCQAGSCSTFVDSFCLQFSRPSPGLDSEYQLAPGGAITLAGRKPDGSVIRLPAEGLVTIRSRSGFSAVTISLAEGQVANLGLRDPALEIGPMSSILPVAVPGDSDPQTAQDIAYATGSQRRLAGKIFEARSPDSDMARLVAMLINSLPAEEPVTPAGRREFWHKVQLSVAGAFLDPRAVAAASAIFGNCGTAVDAGTAPALGTCMEQAQGDLIGMMELEWQGANDEARPLDEGGGGS